MASANSITEEMVSEFKELLYYDQNSGLFTWIKGTNRNIRVGDSAGSRHKAGYTQISINGYRYLSHRLAWAFTNGSISNSVQIDHINCVKNDNRIKNLRIATHSENQQNINRPRAGNPSGFLGVSWVRCIRTAKKFRASIAFNGNIKYLGYFRTAKEAHEAYLIAKRELHPFCTI